MQTGSCQIIKQAVKGAGILGRALPKMLRLVFKYSSVHLLASQSESRLLYAKSRSPTGKFLRTRWCQPVCTWRFPSQWKKLWKNSVNDAHFLISMTLLLVAFGSVCRVRNRDVEAGRTQTDEIPPRSALRSKPPRNQRPHAGTDHFSDCLLSCGWMRMMESMKCKH